VGARLITEPRPLASSSNRQFGLYGSQGSNLTHELKAQAEEPLRQQLGRAEGET